MEWYSRWGHLPRSGGQLGVGRPRCAQLRVAHPLLQLLQQLGVAGRHGPRTGLIAALSLLRLP
ncbi:hypothetical protein GCM10027586_18560 [Kineococcus gypseus]